MCARKDHPRARESRARVARRGVAVDNPNYPAWSRYARDVDDGDVPISGTPSPSFDRPPLVEVALGVEFSPVPGFGAVALVRLADGLHDRYPVVQEYPPLPPNPPIGVDDQIGGGLVVNMGAPSIRLWLLSQEQDQLLQVQRDRLILNWRAVTGSGSYPRYRDALRPAFAREYQGLLSFLTEAELPPSVPVGVEVTYINVATGSDESSDIGAILRSQRPSAGRLGAPGTTRLQQQWKWTGHDGAASILRIDAEQSTGERPAIAVNLTARSALSTNAGVDDVLRSLDLCHDEVVSAFVELTEPDRHLEWGRTS